MSIETEIKGSPASITKLATWISDELAPSLDDAADAMVTSRRSADGDWLGETGTAFVGAMGRGATQVDEGHTMTKGVGTTISEYASTLTGLQSRMSTIRDDARASGLTVSGYVIEDPGPGPADPGPPPEGGAPGAVTTYNGDVADYDAHQDKIRDYNRLSVRAQDVWDDLERAWERVSAKQRALDGPGWTFALSDMAGGFGGAAITYNASALRGTAQGYATNAQQHLARLRNMDSYPSRFAQQYYDDLAHYDEVVRNSSDDVARAARLARIGKALPLAAGGALAGVGIWYDMKYNDESATQATASNVGGFAASVATGAVVGTAIGGPVGTVAGVVVGAGVGVFTSGMIDGLFEYDGDISDAAMAGVDTLADTGEALLDGASDVGGAVVDGIGGLFD
jgi:hypothetical protein